jgi:hypothetical protein
VTTATATRPTSATPWPTVPAGSTTLEAALDTASEAVLPLEMEDPCWEEVGPALTAFVDAARRVDGRPGSPIGPDDAVSPALRLRDLARLAQQAHRSGQQVVATAEVEWRLRSLQVAAIR